MSDFQTFFQDPPTSLPRYEQRLALDPRWALSEGSKHFEENSAVQFALQKIARRLEELGISYAIAGGMALFRHGFRRFTVDVDILVTAEGLKRIHQELEGLGYLPPFAGSKNLRDTDLGVRVVFLVAGQFPGDQQPKPVAFPDPAQVAQELEGIRYVNLPTLIELKLASGMTNPLRGKDLVDIQELMDVLHLPRDFAEKLNPFVQPKFLELWHLLHQPTRRYLRVWPSSGTHARVATMDDLIAQFPEAADLLAAMKADGVTVDAARTTPETVFLVTADPDMAAKYDMHEESEFLTGNG